MNVEKDMNYRFYFVRWDDVPVLVKFNDFAVYLPVFRSYEEALLASKDFLISHNVQPRG